MQPTRREIIGTAASLGLALPAVVPGLVRAASPNETVGHASVGAAARAWGDLHEITQHRHAKLVAVCDVDERRFRQVAEAHPDVPRYKDWREMYEREGKRIDSVNVSTPDHGHAIQALTAMRMGIHVYCQKPLARWLHEVRRLTEYAEAHPELVTQLGIQSRSRMEYRLAVHMVESGLLGRVRRIHAWSNKDGWGGGSGRPEQTHDVPDELAWDLWLSVAPQRPYTREVYHPRYWRNWFDFGSGLMGDMGAHILDSPVSALQLGPPLRIRSEGPKSDAERWPDAAKVEYHFAGTSRTVGDEIQLTWHSGGMRPGEAVAQHLPEDQDVPDQGSLLVGEDATMLLPHFGAPRVYPREILRDYDRPELEADNHYLQFIDAVRGEGEVRAPFRYGGPLTETVLIGTVAQHVPGRTLEWNAEACRFDDEQANELLWREYRSEWRDELLSQA